MENDVVELVEQLRKRFRVLLNKPDTEFEERDSLELGTICDLLAILEMELPEDYFSIEKSLERFRVHSQHTLHFLLSSEE